MEKWFENFPGLFLDYWRARNPPEQTQAEIDCLQSLLAVQPGSRLLDVPCGNGRIAIALSARGHRLTGLDISPELLAEARASAAEIEWIEGNMRDLHRTAEFDGAFCWGNSYGFMDDPGNREFLAAVASSLKPKARFVLDTGAAAESLLPTLQLRRWHRVADILFLAEGTYNACESRLEMKYTFIRGGVEQTEMVSLAVYTVAELRRMLECAGFNVMALYRSLDAEPFELGAKRLILVANKP